MKNMPHEIAFGEVYLPPLIITVAIGYVLATTVSSMAAKKGMYNHVALPALVELSLVVIFTGIIGLFIPVF
jgi:intracellular septation protein A